MWLQLKNVATAIAAVGGVDNFNSDIAEKVAFTYVKPANLKCE